MLPTRTASRLQIKQILWTHLAKSARISPNRSANHQLGQPQKWPDASRHVSVAQVSDLPFRQPFKMAPMLDRHAVQEALNAGHGILRLEPCWVNDRRNLVASSPKRFDQRASISGIRSGQILTAASPLAVSRTGQSARMPRPLPKPARFPAASATTPHRSRQPSLGCESARSQRSNRNWSIRQKPQHIQPKHQREARATALHFEHAALEFAIEPHNLREKGRKWLVRRRHNP